MTIVSGLKYQFEYESALGRLLVRFNDLEIVVGHVLDGTLTTLKLPHLYRDDHYFIQKVERLELALAALPTWPRPSFDRLRKINGWRNNMAHGHFHQDPHTGDYVTRPVRGAGSKAKAVTPAEIDAYTDEVRNAHSEVSGLLPHVWFDDLDT